MVLIFDLKFNKNNFKNQNQFYKIINKKNTFIRKDKFRVNYLKMIIIKYFFLKYH